MPGPKNHGGKIRILFVIDNLGFGGGERGFAQLISRLNRDEFEPVVVSCPEGPFAEQVKNAGVKLIGFDFSRLVQPLNIYKLKKILGLENPDIIHVQGARVDFYVRIAAHLAGADVFISTIQMMVEGYNINVFRKLIYTVLMRATERLVTHFVVVSEALKNVLVSKHGINPINVSVIHNGIELERYDCGDSGDLNFAFRERFGIPTGVLIFGALGRLVWQKGISYLIESVPTVLEQFPDSLCVIVGEGPLGSQLEQQARNLGIKKHVLFTGFMKDVRPAIAAMDVVVMPSLLEGQPLTAMEVMAMAKPFVSSDITSMKNLVQNGVNGILVKPTDTRELAYGIKRLLSDRKLAQQYGFAARKYAEKHFDVNQMITCHEELYKRVVM